MFESVEFSVFLVDGLYKGWAYGVSIHLEVIESPKGHSDSPRVSFILAVAAATTAAAVAVAAAVTSDACIADSGKGPIAACGGGPFELSVKVEESGFGVSYGNQMHPAAPAVGQRGRGGNKGPKGSS